ncbi:hypothetical protein QTP88_023035 [Uroleucon formosanum]
MALKFMAFIFLMCYVIVKNVESAKLQALPLHLIHYPAKYHRRKAQPAGGSIIDEGCDHRECHPPSVLLLLIFNLPDLQNQILLNEVIKKKGPWAINSLSLPTPWPLRVPPYMSMLHNMFVTVHQKKKNQKLILTLTYFENIYGSKRTTNHTSDHTYNDDH